MFLLLGFLFFCWFVFVWGLEGLSGSVTSVCFSDNGILICGWGGRLCRWFICLVGLFFFWGVGIFVVCVWVGLTFLHVFLDFSLL